MKIPASLKPLRSADSLPAFDFTIFALGYESRAINIAKTVAPVSRKQLALGFAERKVLSYEANRKWFEAHGHEVIEENDANFPNLCDKLRLRLNAVERAHVVIGIDISSFNRFRLACLIDMVRHLRPEKSVSTYFWYSLAQFSPPAAGFVPNSHVGPIHPRFAGWFVEPELPPVAIVGLGYEEDKALGAVEHIEATAAWAFIPSSPLSQYKVEVERANQPLLESVPEQRQLIYDVGNPITCLATLQSLTQGLMREANVVLFPFGPKIFALNCLIVASSEPNLAVWRVSSLEYEEPVDRIPSQHVYGLCVEWSEERQHSD